MLAFAANSLLGREALAAGHIGAARFTTVRVLSGAVMLGVLVAVKTHTRSIGGDWGSALALVGYAAAFSFAYLSLSAGTGALILFAAVEVTMIGYGVWTGERISRWQVVGVLLAFGGLVWLMLPGVEAPPLAGTLLMLAAGVSWGVYSLRGRRTQAPTVATAGNFIRATPLALLLFLAMETSEPISAMGVAYAVASGALASGLGYAIWYAVVPMLSATSAATVQLSVPIIAAFGGVLLLDEPITMRLGLASIAVLGGILLFMLTKREA
ncbi:MAG: DMT family transporter [Bacteroidota bacterium]